MRPLTKLQTDIFNSIRNQPGIGSTTLAETMGRDRNQIRKAALRLVELGHCSVRRTDAGDFFSGRGVGSAPRRAVEMKAHVAADLHIERPVPQVDQNEPIDVPFRTVSEPSNFAPARQPFAGTVIHRMPSEPHARFAAPNKSPTSPRNASTGIVLYDPMGEHFRQQSARLAELENAEIEREESALRAAPLASRPWEFPPSLRAEIPSNWQARPPLDMVAGAARVAFDALKVLGSLSRPLDPPRLPAASPPFASRGDSTSNSASPESRPSAPRSHREDWFTSDTEPAPRLRASGQSALVERSALSGDGASGSPVAVPVAVAVAATPFWRRRRQIEQPPVKKSRWY
jgi:hypothetical protein